MISWYGRFVVLPDEVKQRNKIKVGAKIPRLDCIQSAGYYKGTEPFINSKGMFKFHLMRTDKIKADGSRKADNYLQGEKSMNFSSIYPFLELDGKVVAFGNPNDKPTVKRRVKGKQTGVENPMLPFQNDAYIFICNKDFTQIELLVIEQGKYLIQAYCKQLINGGFNEELKTLRQTAKEFYQY